MSKKAGVGIIVFIILVATPIIYFKKSKPLDQTVHVYAYSSFTALWGPGPMIKEKFEKKCQCQIVFHDASDSRMLVQRSTLEGATEKVDVVLGVDQFDIEKLSQRLGLRVLNTSEVNWTAEIRAISYPQGAVPFDWGVLTFNYKKNIPNPAPTSFEDLLSPKYKGRFVLQDPRTSSPGLQFLTWIIRVMGEESAWSYLQKLSNHWHSVAGNWSSSYGMFDKGIVDMVFSYTTSPLYHQIEEKVEKSFLVDFKTPVPMQVEFAAVAERCQNCEQAEAFVRVLLEPEIQKIIMTKNYMYPVVAKVVDGTAFDTKSDFKPIFYVVTEEEKLNWVNRWKELMDKGSQ